MARLKKKRVYKKRVNESLPKPQHDAMVTMLNDFCQNDPEIIGFMSSILKDKRRMIENFKSSYEKTGKYVK